MCLAREQRPCELLDRDWMIGTVGAAEALWVKIDPSYSPGSRASGQSTRRIIIDEITNHAPASVARNHSMRALNLDDDLLLKP